MRSGTNSNCHAPRTSTEAKWAKTHNLAESSFIFNCRESSSRIHPQQSQYEKSRLSPSSRPFGDEIWAPVLPMLPFSHSNLPTYSSYIYLPYLHVRRSRRRDDGGESPSWTQFGRYSVFFFFFSFCNYFTVPARAVDQRIRCRSIAELFFFRVIAWLQPTDYELIKAFPDQEGTEFSTDDGGDLSPDLLHWFRRIRADLPARERADLPFSPPSFLFLIIF